MNQLITIGQEKSSVDLPLYGYLSSVQNTTNFISDNNEVGLKE